MEHLHSKEIVHRDLAARNILVHIENGNIIPKITDFGLSRQQLTKEYYQLNNSAVNVPIKWTAPEVFMYYKFYKSSDVWSFGVVCWECFSDGDVPIPSKTNDQVIEYVINPENEKKNLCILDQIVVHKTFTMTL